MIRVGDAREAARQWVIDEAGNMPGFCGAYTAGSTNWLADDVCLASTSDLDVMVILADASPAFRRHKFRYRDVLLEASFLDRDQLDSPAQVLGDVHLAPSLHTSRILLDPSGHLASLRENVCRDYARRHWVLERCANARDAALKHLQSINQECPLHDLVTSCLFGAGVTTHILLAAGLGNPTVRTRYVAVRELLADYDCLEIDESLLELLGSSRMTCGQVRWHLTALAAVFDRAAKIIGTPFPFASDLSDLARPVAIDGSLDLIERGYHREAMFWIAVTHSRCQKVLAADAPAELGFRESYQALAADLGIASLTDARRRREEIERFLPVVWKAAERVIAANPHIENA